MSPFEDLIHGLGAFLETTLEPDERQSCLIHFSKEDIDVQIDLGTNADQILIGCDLGRPAIGKFREEILFQAMRMNGMSMQPRGILAYSPKKDALILFQYLTLLSLTPDSLYAFLQLFIQNATLWHHAIARGTIPKKEEIEQLDALLGSFQ